MDEKQFFEGRAVVLTALPLEYKAIRAHLTHIQEEVYKGTIYERGNFLAEKWHWNVGIAQIGAGNPGAAAEADRKTLSNMASLSGLRSESVNTTIQSMLNG